MDVTLKEESSNDIGNDSRPSLHLFVQSPTMETPEQGVKSVQT